MSALLGTLKGTAVPRFVGPLLTSRREGILVEESVKGCGPLFFCERVDGCFLLHSVRPRGRRPTVGRPSHRLLAVSFSVSVREGRVHQALLWRRRLSFYLDLPAPAPAPVALFSTCLVVAGGSRKLGGSPRCVRHFPSWDSPSGAPVCPCLSVCLSVFLGVVALRACDMVSVFVSCLPRCSAFRACGDDESLLRLEESVMM